jgi:hypothetical protein
LFLSWCTEYLINEMADMLSILILDLDISKSKISLNRLANHTAWQVVVVVVAMF